MKVVGENREGINKGKCCDMLLNFLNWYVWKEKYGNRKGELIFLVWVWKDYFKVREM